MKQCPSGNSVSRLLEILKNPENLHEYFYLLEL